MSRTIADKMFIKPGTRTFLPSAPIDVLNVIASPNLDLVTTLSGEFGYIHLFVRNRQELAVEFSRLKPHLAKAGALWISWPKGGQLDTDLNLHEVIRIGYERGLVESTCLSIDATWSALRFTHPKPGKTYNNSHATLVRD